MVGTPVSKRTYDASTTLFGLYWILVIVITAAIYFNLGKIVGIISVVGSQILMVSAYLMLIKGIKYKGR